MSRDLHTALSDVSMYRAGKAIREWLAQLSGLIPRLNETPNPYYGTTVDGLVLIEYYGGPSCLGTPYGQWAATGGGCLENKDWRDEAKERLGLELLMPETHNEHGTFGAVWGITKDLDGNPLPKADWKEKCFWPGIKSKNAFDTLDKEQVVRELNKWVYDHEQERPRAVFYFEKTPEGYPFNTESQFLLSTWLDTKWHDMSKQIGYVAWNDRVDPQLHADNVYGLKAWIELQLVQPWLLDVPPFNDQQETRFKVLDFDGNTVHIIDCQTYPRFIKKVWSPAPVSPELFTLAAKLLAARGFVLEEA